jgi:hypothetical protein
MKRRKMLKSQQLVEFLLVVPFIIIILGIVTEYAYALNIDMTLTQGLKDVTSSIYSEIKPGLNPSDIADIVESDLKTYLSNNNVPVKAANNISVKYLPVGGDTSSSVGHVAIFMASYTYIPAFSLPNVYFKFLPDKFNFLASVAVPGAFLVSNSNYVSGVDSTTLDMVWAGTSSFSNLDSFNASKKGIMKDSLNRISMLFLIPTTAPDASIPSGQAYTMVTWDGSSITDSSEDYTLNTSDGKIYKCSSTTCSDTGKAFIDYIKNNGYNDIFFDHDDAVSDYVNQWAYNLNTGNSITVDGSIDLSQSHIDGILKRTLALFNSTNYSIGNYDNINVSSYNSDVSIGNTYTVTSYGSTVIVYINGTDDLTNIKTGTPLNLNTMSFN